MCRRVGNVIICGERRKRCTHCGGHATQLCDGPAPKGAKRQTCDRALCQKCSTRMGALDYCRTCAALGEQAHTSRPTP